MSSLDMDLLMRDAKGWVHTLLDQPAVVVAVYSTGVEGDVLMWMWLWVVHSFDVCVFYMAT